MKLWSAITRAFAGWVLILRGQPGWRDYFTLSAPGFVTALLVFVLAAFIAVIFASLSIGLPSLPGVLAAMFVLALPVITFVLTLLGTRMMLKSQEPMLELLVPGTYALTAFLLVEGALAMIGGPIVMLAWLGIAFMLFCLARAATSWNVGVAFCFAVFSVVLLVALRLALYIVSSSAGITI